MSALQQLPQAAPETVGDLLDRAAPGIGDNSGKAPLAELLVEETAALKSKADELLDTAKDAVVTDETSAENATTLAKMIREQGAAVEAAREERKKPFLESGRLVDAHFKAIKGPLDTAFDALVGLVDRFRKQKEREAEAERKRLEGIRLRAEAEALAAAAKAEMTGSVESAITAQQAVDKVATAAAAVATASKPVVIKSSLGASAGGTKIAVVTLDQPLPEALLKACAYLIQNQPDVVREFVQGRYNALAKSKQRVLPGATVTDDTTTRIR